MRYLKGLLLLGLLSGWGVSAQAAQVVGMYETEVAVADQGPAARASGMAEAMAAVLLKVSGSSAILGEAVMQSAMADAARYVQQYRYRSEEIPTAERKTAAGAAAPQSRLWLWVGFDSASIDNLLRRFGFQVWSAARPTTLVWLAVEDGSRRVLVGANDQGLVREVLEAEARRHAIPLRLPLLDLADQARVRPVDVWGGFIDNIEAASQRYEPQALLLGRLYQAAGGWEARWTLRYQGEEHQWQPRAAEVSAVIAAGVGGTSDYLSRRFAESSYLGGNELALRIEGITGMNDFRRAHDYLLSLQGVAAITLRQVDATSSHFLLTIEGGRESVLQAISLGEVLVKVATPPPEARSLPAAGIRVREVPFPQAPERPMGYAGPAPDEAPVADGAPAASAVQEAQPQSPLVVPLQELVYRLLL